MYFNHSHVFVLTLNYTERLGMEWRLRMDARAYVVRKLNQCLFVAPNATIAAWVCDLDGFWKAVIVFEI